MSVAFACRLCGEPLRTTFVDLGMTPLANTYLPVDTPPGAEPSYPLHAWTCDTCLLVQVHHVATPEQIFGQYAYFSSFSSTWVEHARRFVDGAVERFALDESSFVVEVASNDGYLLQHLLGRGPRMLGIEPAANVAAVALDAGIPTLVRFFSVASAREVVDNHGHADLIVANNVLAHVPDLHDFLGGVSALLSPDGTFSVEVPHLLNLIEHVQYDTIYHEHFSYFSLLSAERALAHHGLEVYDVALLPTHGGSLRLTAGFIGAGRTSSPSVEAVRRAERNANLHHRDGYRGFAQRVVAAQGSVREFFDRVGIEGASVVGYGAAAKGNTLLNCCGVTADDVLCVVDRNPAKQGRLLPGSRIPVRPVDAVIELKPDFLFILPWNLADEIRDTMADIRSWGGRFVTAAPQVAVAS